MQTAQYIFECVLFAATTVIIGCMMCLMCNVSLSWSPLLGAIMIAVLILGSEYM